MSTTGTRYPRTISEADPQQMLPAAVISRLFPASPATISRLCKLWRETKGREGLRHKKARYSGGKSVVTQSMRDRSPVLIRVADAAAYFAPDEF